MRNKMLTSIQKKKIAVGMKPSYFTAKDLEEDVEVPKEDDSESEVSLSYYTLSNATALLLYNICCTGLL